MKCIHTYRLCNVFLQIRIMHISVTSWYHILIDSCLLFQSPGPDARIVYIDGAFDLFHAGHVEVLFAYFIS
jgi:hypothetical protein